MEAVSTSTARQIDRSMYTLSAQTGQSWCGKGRAESEINSP